MRRVRCGLALALAVLLGACAGPGEPRHRAPPPHPPPAAGGAAEYVVQRGDTIYAIAFRNQLDYHDLADWNGIGRSYAIYTGQHLRLTPPADALASGEVPGTPPPDVHAVPSAPRPPTRREAPAAAEETEAPSPLAGAGHWTWPTHGGIARRFGVDGNKGVDLSGASGQVIVAAAGGKVVYSGSALKGYGELIIVKHDEQYLSAYGYNRRRLVEEGQQVQAGQPIAEMGLGPEQQPMLHFEIRDKGRPVDPLPLLPPT